MCGAQAPLWRAAPTISDFPARIRAGVAGGLLGALGIVFGTAERQALGSLAYLIGTGIHFTFAALWGVLFAFIWPYFRDRDFEATGASRPRRQANGAAYASVAAR